MRGVLACFIVLLLACTATAGDPYKISLEGQNLGCHGARLVVSGYSYTVKTGSLTFDCLGSYSSGSYPVNSTLAVDFMWEPTANCVGTRKAHCSGSVRFADNASGTVCSYNASEYLTIPLKYSVSRITCNSSNDGWKVVFSIPNLNGPR